jgi:hypothetical protein
MALCCAYAMVTFIFLYSVMHIWVEGRCGLLAKGSKITCITSDVNYGLQEVTDTNPSWKSMGKYKGAHLRVLPLEPFAFTSLYVFYVSPNSWECHGKVSSALCGTLGKVCSSLFLPHWKMWIWNLIYIQDSVSLCSPDWTWALHFPASAFTSRVQGL